MRLAVYSDYSYRRLDGALWAEVAFARFLAGLAPLPYYRTLANPIEPARAFLISLRRFWKLLSHVDAVWLLGPHPLAVAFGVLATLRGRPVALGVRQDFPAYI